MPYHAVALGLPVHGLLVGLSSLWGTLSVQLNTPASSPWLAAAVAVALLLAGAVLSVGSAVQVKIDSTLE